MGETVKLSSFSMLCCSNMVILTVVWLNLTTLFGFTENLLFQNILVVVTLINTVLIR